MMKAELARKLFLSGCNCSQAVFCAFADDFNVDKETALKLSGPLGGGVGRLRKTCGAVASMAMLVGLKTGISDLSDDKEKARLYKIVQECVKEFTDEYKTTECRELLGGNADCSSSPTPRTKEFYETRPCPKIVYTCAKIIEEKFKK